MKMKYTSFDQKIIDVFNDSGPGDYYKKCAIVGRRCRCSPSKVYKVLQREARTESIRTQYGKFNIAELDLPYQIFDTLDRIGVYRIYEAMNMNLDFWKRYVRLGDRLWNVFQTALNEYFGRCDDQDQLDALLAEMDAEYKVWRLAKDRMPKTSLAETISMMAATHLMLGDHPYG